MPDQKTFLRLFFAVVALCLFDFAEGVLAQENGDTGAVELRIAGLKEYNLGHFTEAHKLLDRAMVLAVERNDSYLVALIHDGLGGIYQDEFQFAKAEQEFIKAAAILRGQAEHAHALAMTLANLGAVLSAERRYREASIRLLEASSLIKDNSINDPQLQVHVLDVSATVHLEEGQSKKAEALFQQALKICLLPQNAKILEVADVFNNLGTLYAARKDYSKAVASYNRALDEFEKRLEPSHPSITTVLGNLGLVYIQMRKYEQAESQFLRSLSILESNGLMVSTMGLNTMNRLGRTYVERNQMERAEPLLARAVETGRKLGARTAEMADTLELYSNVLQNLSRRSEARNLHAEAALIRAELAWTTRAGR